MYDTRQMSSVVEMGYTVTRPPLVDEGAGMVVVAHSINFAETTPDDDVHSGTITSSHAEACILNDVEPASVLPRASAVADICWQKPSASRLAS